MVKKLAKKQATEAQRRLAAQGIGHITAGGAYRSPAKEKSDIARNIRRGSSTVYSITNKYPTPELTATLRRVRDTYSRRIKQLTKTANELRKIGNYSAAIEHEEAAATLEYERSNAKVKAVKSGINAKNNSAEEFTKEYYKRVGEIEKRISNIPNIKPSAMVQREALGKIRMRYARDIMVFTYGSVWGKGDSPEQRRQKLINEVKKQTGKMIVSDADVIEYYEQAIKDYYDDEYYSVGYAPFEDTDITEARYEKDLSLGYSRFLGR